MDAELDAIICSAGRIGKQFAYGLLDGLPPGISPDHPIAELARRYFRSRAPATVQDFAWWAGLTLTEARKGLEAVRTELGHPEPTSLSGKAGRPGKIYLLPAFDEYMVAYKNRNDVLDPAFAAPSFYGLKPIVVHNTRIVGIWQRTIKKEKAHIEIIPFQRSLPERPLATAMRKYERFIAG
jgi:hypothetical protein